MATAGHLDTDDLILSCNIISIKRSTNSWTSFNRGRDRSYSRSPSRERKRRRSRSPSLSSDRPPSVGGTPDDAHKTAKKETKAKKPKGSKLFKEPKKQDEDIGGGGGGGKAPAGSVEFWNDERAKLGLKPLK